MYKICCQKWTIIFLAQNPENWEGKKKELPGGDPEPLEQLEFPIELKPDEDGLTEA